jgi:hypothetical protein
MDITDTSPPREQLGIERFAAGEASLSFEGVMFWKDRGGFLVVESFSEFVHPGSSSVSEAAQKIARSKEVLLALSARSPAFKCVVESMPHKYEFCHSYEKGGVKLAWLNDNEVVWCR